MKDIFNKRAEKLTDHDPWRYGQELSLKTDLIEINWVKKYLKKGTLLDIGCGTGRHCLELSKVYPDMVFYCFDFAENNISILDSKIAKEGVINIKTKVCDAKDVSVTYKNMKFDNILSIGLIQYLGDKDLDTHLKDCFDLLNDDGILMIKHPTSFADTFVFNGYSDFLQSNYRSIYRNFKDVSLMFMSLFEIDTLESTFDRSKLTPQEFGEIERNGKTRQMWFLLRKKKLH